MRWEGAKLLSSNVTSVLKLFLVKDQVLLFSSQTSNP